LIESYEFGEMVIDGKRYTSDLIIFPERIVDGWWRKEGHKVHIEDLETILGHDPKPELLVLGTGYHGLVEVQIEVRNTLKSREIGLTAQPTKKACQTFNKLLKSNKQIVGAFHLTC
jgi:hypothetical protein